MCSEKGEWQKRSSLKKQTRKEREREMAELIWPLANFRIQFSFPLYLFFLQSFNLTLPLPLWNGHYSSISPGETDCSWNCSISITVTTGWWSRTDLPLSYFLEACVLLFGIPHANNTPWVREKTDIWCLSLCGHTPSWQPSHKNKENITAEPFLPFFFRHTLPQSAAALNTCISTSSACW